MLHDLFNIGSYGRNSRGSNKFASNCKIVKNPSKSTKLIYIPLLQWASPLRCNVEVDSQTCQCRTQSHGKPHKRCLSSALLWTKHLSFWSKSCPGGSQRHLWCRWGTTLEKAWQSLRITWNYNTTISLSWIPCEVVIPSHNSFTFYFMKKLIFWY